MNALILFSYSKTEKLNKIILSSHKCTLEKCKRSVRKLHNITLVGKKSTCIEKFSTSMKEGLRRTMKKT